MARITLMSAGKVIEAEHVDLGIVGDKLVSEFHLPDDFVFRSVSEGTASPVERFSNDKAYLRKGGFTLLAVDGDPVDLPAQPIRRQVLDEAANIVCGERQEDYGDPNVQLKCAGELKAVFDKYNIDRDAAHTEAIHAVLMKLARIACGPKFKLDNYVDAAGYVSLAAEVRSEVLRNTNSPKES